MADKYPTTLAVRALRAAGLAFQPHTFSYEPHGGTRHSSEALGIPEHQVIKTLIFEDDQRRPLCILMHGDREVSTRNLARQMGVRSVQPCTPEVAQKHSGYLVGGTSPFGLKKPMPIFAERSIFDLERIAINGGARGFLVTIAPKALETLGVTPVEVAV